MRRLLRFLPASTRLYLRVWQRHCADFVSGRHRLMAATAPVSAGMPAAISVQQAIAGGDAAAHKIQNLQIAIACLQGVVLQPGQMFSFWHLVGQPSSKKGYQKSRSIVQGQVVAETGGGLCQLSGLIYLLALKAGLTIAERHAHSLDIYREAERFAPLGSDATVSFGYKDLRFVNNLPHPIGLRFSITKAGLQGCITSDVPITERGIRFGYTWQNGSVSVATWANDTLIGHTVYTRLYPNGE
jgi:vancomycin resistance protein VanW